MAQENSNAMILSHVVWIRVLVLHVQKMKLMKIMMFQVICDKTWNGQTKLEYMKEAYK